MGLGHGDADGLGDALAQRAAGGIDARSHAEFWVTGGLGIELAEGFEIIKAHLIARKMKQGIEESASVARRKDEAVAVGPGGHRARDDPGKAA